MYFNIEKSRIHDQLSQSNVHDRQSNDNDLSTVLACFKECRKTVRKKVDRHRIIPEVRGNFSDSLEFLVFVVRFLAILK